MTDPVALSEDPEVALAEYRVHSIVWGFHEALAAARRREYFMQQARLAKSAKDMATVKLAVRFARDYQRTILWNLRRVRKAV